MQINLTKERAFFFADELKKWEVDAKIVHESESWATVEVSDDEDPLDICEYAFNIGVKFGREMLNK